MHAWLVSDLPGRAQSHGCCSYRRCTASHIFTAAACRPVLQAISQGQRRQHKSIMPATAAARGGLQSSRHAWRLQAASHQVVGITVCVLHHPLATPGRRSGGGSVCAGCVCYSSPGLRLAGLSPDLVEVWGLGQLVQAMLQQAQAAHILVDPANAGMWCQPVVCAILLAGHLLARVTL